jgi:predicted SAM-dependent methyltransferase
MRLKRAGTRSTSVTKADDDRQAVLHVGCGPPSPERLHSRFRSPEWREVRLDVDPGVSPDIVDSIVSMRKVESDAYDALWSSHNLEHIYAHEVPLALRAFLRVLRPGGVALITVPDLQQAAKAIVKNGLEATFYVSPAGPITPLDMFYGHRRSIREGNDFMAHRTGFTARTLEEKLREVGFADIEVKAKNDNAIWATAHKAA